MPVRIITPPAKEPVTLVEVKEYIKVDGQESDNILTSLIKSAREYCETFQNRSFITQTLELVLDDFPNMPLKLPRPPLQSVVNIKYINDKGTESTWDTSNYIVDNVSEPGRVTFASGVSWPSVALQEINSFKVQFNAGYGDNESDVPESVKEAIKIYVAHRFDYPESEDVPEAVHNLLWQERVVPI